MTECSRPIFLADPKESYRRHGCIAIRMTTNRRFVYVLKNSSQPPRYYTGLTSDLRARLVEHNAGKCIATASGRPWQLDVVLKFADERRAWRLSASSNQVLETPSQSDTSDQETG